MLLFPYRTIGIWKRTVDEDTDHAHDHAHIDTESQSNVSLLNLNAALSYNLGV